MIIRYGTKQKYNNHSLLSLLLKITRKIIMENRTERVFFENPENGRSQDLSEFKKTKKKSISAVFPVNMIELEDNDHGIFKNKLEESIIWKMKLEQALDSVIVQIFMGLVTVYGLFSDDIRMLAFSKSTDNIFYTLTCIAMGLFTVEIFLSCFVKQEYFNGFFFWLDIISTVSLVGDVAWIVPETSVESETTTDFTKQIRAGRAARIIRLIRFIRLMRISKLYKEAQIAKEINLKKKRETFLNKLQSIVSLREENLRSGDLVVPSPRNDIIIGCAQISRAIHDRSWNPDLDDLSIPKESKISKKLLNLTMQRVVVLILLLSLSLPLISADSYFGVSYPSDYSMRALSDASIKMSSTQFTTLCEYYAFHRLDEDKYPLIVLEGPGCGPYTFVIKESELRETEVIRSEYGSFSSVIDIRYLTGLKAGLGIGRTLFLCILLAVGSIIFSHDTNVLVLHPLESMLEKARTLINNPMAFCQGLNDEEFGVYSMQQKIDNIQQQEHYETTILENIFVKIATLLALEFGEAGTRIMAENLSNNEFLNPLIPGTKIYGIFAFISIHQFRETTEVLKERIMLYVNYVAEIVHSNVDKYFGFINNNIGNTYLVLWKLQNESVDQAEDGLIAKNILAGSMFDMSIFSFLKIYAKIAKLEHLHEFKKRIRQSLPNFQIRLGFGMHTGWAIEGAIGSIHKIDASYLSPIVNISARLQAATKQYGVSILISGQVHRNLSPHLRKLCREIDTVTVKGSKYPLQLFTIDLNTQHLDKKLCKHQGEDQYTKRAKRMKAKKQLQAEFRAGFKNSHMLFRRDKDIRKLTTPRSETFKKYFSKGYNCYIEGQWEKAETLFHKALEKLPNDGPTQTLLQYMGKFNNKAPEEWGGYRELTDKQIESFFHVVQRGNKQFFYINRRDELVVFFML